MAGIDLIFHHLKIRPSIEELLLIMGEIAQFYFCQPALFVGIFIDQLRIGKKFLI